ncbi:MAG TPA: hypothetical protein VL527_00275 [Dongiaceae bacterium]|nr:hypothetical protein [Dongiaceae bacterium]
MKTSKLKWFALMALGGLMTLAPLTPARAQEQTPAQDQKPAGGRREAIKGRLEMLAKQLDLTEAQKEKLKPILKDQAEQLKALRADTNMSRDDKMAKLKEIRESLNAQLKTILTPEQMEKWQKLRENMAKRRAKTPEAPADTSSSTNKN